MLAHEAVQCAFLNPSEASTLKISMGPLQAPGCYLPMLSDRVYIWSMPHRPGAGRVVVPGVIGVVALVAIIIITTVAAAIVSLQAPVLLVIVATATRATLQWAAGAQLEQQQHQHQHHINSTANHCLNHARYT